MASLPPKRPKPKYKPKSNDKSMEICRKFQIGQCNKKNCKYWHIKTEDLLYLQNRNNDRNEQSPKPQPQQTSTQYESPHQRQQREEKINIIENVENLQQQQEAAIYEAKQQKLHFNHLNENYENEDYENEIDGITKIEEIEHQMQMLGNKLEKIRRDNHVTKKLVIITVSCIGARDTDDPKPIDASGTLYLSKYTIGEPQDLASAITNKLYQIIDKTADLNDALFEKLLEADIEEDEEGNISDNPYGHFAEYADL